MTKKVWRVFKVRSSGAKVPFSEPLTKSVAEKLHSEMSQKDKNFKYQLVRLVKANG